MSPPPGCSTCWPAADVRRLVEHAEGRIAAATAALWPRTETTFGPTLTAGSAILRQVHVGPETLCATLRPAGTPLTGVVLGDCGDLAAVLSDEAGDADATAQEDATAREAEQLTALVAYSGLRVAGPIATVRGVMFAPWVTGASLTSRLQDRPAALTHLLTTLMDDLGELHRDPPEQLRQVAAPTTLRTHPRILAQALAHSVNHLHSAPAQPAGTGELGALLGTLSLRLTRLAAQLDPLLVTRTGIAFGGLTPRHVLYPETSSRPVLVSPDLGPGGEPADIGTLLGHLHLLALDSPPTVRSDFVEGIEAYLAGRVAAHGAEWNGWLTLVMTTWAATVYDTVVAALTLPAALPLDPAIGQLAARPLPALADVKTLTGELRRRGALPALNATLAALAGRPADDDDVERATTTARR
ncbi:hypothetical protein ThrDRAFT_03904 [Frankia casuarinae]|uniref:Phosphotransferase n=2 Tax=Frankia TaxID=1854 RepID=Q2JBY1_FRACC|nr:MULTISPECIES: hypothetical protein [Frankia]ABD11211.1 hypothetical protein Francci3_1835 [Frankia casuarinae]EYT90445.1 hypothetical protein ThrDRAFT_03904 [Frankia casuarinae]KFB03285.1 hypothetical protein ALLO2DRAFT_03967 [Frankia sp. Allo2]OFB42819.1 hypothetical protein Manayef4_14160 [Frankia sp. CgIM4]OHV51219.1 hypothetical protein CgIS1_19225 [Frankia sp. CgIS1]